jgi:hypothetical protein
MVTLVSVETAYMYVVHASCMSYKNAGCTAGSTEQMYVHGNGPLRCVYTIAQSDEFYLRVCLSIKLVEQKGTILLFA